MLKSEEKLYLPSPEQKVCLMGENGVQESQQIIELYLSEGT